MCYCLPVVFCHTDSPGLYKRYTQCIINKIIFFSGLLNVLGMAELAPPPPPPPPPIVSPAPPSDDDDDDEVGKATSESSDSETDSDATPVPSSIPVPPPPPPAPTIEPVMTSVDVVVDDTPAPVKDDRKLWERPWSLKELKNATECWTLAADAGVRNGFSCVISCWFFHC